MELRRGFWYFFITADLPLKLKLDESSGGDSELRNHPSLPWPPCGYPSHEVASLQPPIPWVGSFSFWGIKFVHLCLLPSLQVPAGCCVEPAAAFQLAYQGYPWKPAKGYETLSFQISMFVFFQSSSQTRQCFLSFWGKSPKSSAHH